jgi:large subunit ribosomal protein L17
MRHLKRGRKLNRTKAHRKAMFNNMVTSLLRHERIVTTLPKAKELRGVAARVITYGKRGRLLRLETEEFAKSVEYKKLDQQARDTELRNRKGQVARQYRLAARYVNDPEVLDAVFRNYADRFSERPGGYTRIMKLGWRRGDAADMAIIELMPDGASAKPKRRARPKTDDVDASAPVTTKETFTDEPEEAVDEAPAVEETTAEDAAADGDSSVEADAAPEEEAEVEVEAPVEEASVEDAPQEEASDETKVVAEEAAAEPVVEEATVEESDDSKTD